MADHLASLGFVTSSKKKWKEVIYRAADEGQKIPSPNGVYSMWSPGEGIEMWVALDAVDTRVIHSFNPHFKGSGRFRVRIVRTIIDENYLLEGKFEAWVNPIEEKPKSGDYPFVFAVPDYDLHKDKLVNGQIVTIQLAAFAHELNCFDDDKTYYESQGGDDGRRKFGAEHFLPLGLFIEQKNPGSPPPARASFAGHVQGLELRTNPISGHNFYYLSVSSAGGVLDVVADPRIVKGQPILNGVIEGTFWMSARLVEN